MIPYLLLLFLLVLLAYSAFYNFFFLIFFCYSSSLFYPLSLYTLHLITMMMLIISYAEQYSALLISIQKSRFALTRWSTLSAATTITTTDDPNYHHWLVD